MKPLTWRQLIVAILQSTPGASEMGDLLDMPAKVGVSEIPTVREVISVDPLFDGTLLLRTAHTEKPNA